MAFNFKLERILGHRKNLENIARKNYYDALANLNSEKTKLENYYTSIDEARQNACQIQTQGGSGSPEVLCQIHDFIKGTEILIERQRHKVRDAAKIVEEKQELLREASIEYKMIERLKERKKEEYRLEERKREEKRTNESNMVRFKVGALDE